MLLCGSIPHNKLLADRRTTHARRLAHLRTARVWCGKATERDFVSVVALSVLKVLRYQAISDSVGVPISPQNPLDMGGAFVFAWLFFSFLNRQEKKQPPSAGGEQ